MAAPDHAAFHRTYEAYSQVRSEHEKLMRAMSSGQESVSVELATESAQRLMAALQATYQGSPATGPGETHMTSTCGKTESRSGSTTASNGRRPSWNRSAEDSS